MKVLIVAKTRQGSRACVGGITSEGQSVRLRAADYDTDESAGMEYEVGDVWDVEFAPAPCVTPPHVENVIVYSGRRLGSAHDLVGSIERYMPPLCGDPGLLYEGTLQAQDSGSLYVAASTGIPHRSTVFWRPDQPLTRDDSSKRIRYRYPTADGGRSLVFTGFQDPPASLPAGTLLRVSLAHWWRPDDSDDELRCYVQLSGWYELDEQAPRTAPATTATSSNREAAGPSGDPRDFLKSVFGYESFRPLQAEVIHNVLSRRDTLAIMPTGSGKSLCYQLPALMFDGLTAVVSPLISLMQDQVDQLGSLGVPAAILNSTLGYRESMEVMQRARRGDIKLLYTSPETLLRPETRVLLERCNVACLTIDEAHCISEWGHDFRPEYRQLLPVRRQCLDAVCLAFTATATRRVQDDIAAQLGLRDEDRFVASFDRPNLFLSAEKRVDGGLGRVRRFLEEHRSQSGIIYCTSRRKVDELTALLHNEGWPVLPYHAGLDDELRKHNQMMFSYDQTPIIVATIAFGMGINKSNVRFVLHFNLPDSIEQYFQEIGRAGRDGLPAYCLLLYNRSDVFVHKHFIEQGAENERRGRNERLNSMLRYAQGHGCRRAHLLRYFGETPRHAKCDCCDVCLGSPLKNVVPPSAVSSDTGLMERLRLLRKELAAEESVPPFVVFSDRVLTQIASRLPQTASELLAVHGIGEYKLRKYGDRLLAAVRNRR